MKLNIKAFSLAFGLIWGFGLFCLTWWIIAFDGVTGETTIIGHVYRGLNISPGSLIGLVWAFADGVIGGVISYVFIIFLLAIFQPVKLYKNNKSE